MAVEPIELTELEQRAENIYEAIVVMSKRARQINEEMKIRLNQELETFTTQIDPEDDSEVNPEQLRISIEYEKMPKPTQQALQDMLLDRIHYRYKEE